MRGGVGGARGGEGSGGSRGGHSVHMCPQLSSTSMQLGGTGNVFYGPNLLLSLLGIAVCPAQLHLAHAIPVPLLRTSKPPRERYCTKNDKGMYRHV